MARSKRRLRDEYRGVDDATPDVLLALDGPLTLHLPAHDRDGPACSRSENHDWRLVETANALAYGGRLCHGCFELHLEHLARDAASPVERVDDGLEDLERAKADGGRPGRLSTLTEKVGRTTGSSDVFHAPTADKRSLCGTKIDLVADREVLGNHFRPCKDCFDLGGASD